VPSPRQAGHTYIIDGADHPIKFVGVLVADITTSSTTIPRWTEMELYHLTDGTDRYVVHIIGCSVLYHVHNGECNAGVGTKYIDLPEDAEPCPRCRPKPQTDCDQDDNIIDYEVDRHTAYVCANAEEAVNKLRSTSAKNASRSFSGPAWRLLTAAAQQDPAISAVINAVEEL
jgi:hypothetical protein